MTPAPTAPAAEPHVSAEAGTRAEVVRLLLEDGPLSATEIGSRLGLSAAGARRHIEALVEQGEAMVASGAGAHRRGPGRPAKQFQLTAAGRAGLGHAYDDLAGDAIRALRELGGEDAVAEFARRRVRSIVRGVTAADDGLPVAAEDAAGQNHAPSGSPDADERIAATADAIAEAMSGAGYVANTRRVGNGVQICQHHCPVAHVAAEFPEFCEAEQEAFRDLLGTHIQQLATIANGDAVCTTHVPLGLPPDAGGRTAPSGPPPQGGTRPRPG
ncbi:helix-turn-helix transcriptional regulator [Tomitella fengzijianii]|uniref:Transcriptional regulator n=1 Tax=Tomitella fengzijianii TaxID=2597660 RepID=A0A516X452_9ACTN|nr:metalloregulator ArsR/SmtB family transcription factor [Tomitella fengzijianii]QDQ97431.1 transcriptional regulator [Tomitella fengzijianii]